MDRGAIGDDAEDELALGRELLTDVGGRLRQCDAAATPAQGDLQPQAVARHDLPAKLRVVDAAQVHARLRRRLAVAHENRGHLRERLDHQHRGHQRCARKVPLEELFVNGDVLDGDEPTARLVLEDGVDEHRRIAVTQAIERLRYVDDTRASLPEPLRPPGRPDTTATAQFQRLTRRAVARLAKRP